MHGAPIHTDYSGPVDHTSLAMSIILVVECASFNRFEPLCRATACSRQSNASELSTDSCSGLRPHRYWRFTVLQAARSQVRYNSSIQYDARLLSFLFALQFQFQFHFDILFTMTLPPVNVHQNPYEALKERNWEPLVFSHPTLPNKKYRLSQASDLGTLVERIDTSRKTRNPIKRLKAIYVRAVQVLPLLMCFHREYIFTLGKWRLAMYFACHAYLGISTSWRNKLLSRTIMQVSHTHFDESNV